MRISMILLPGLTLAVCFAPTAAAQSPFDHQAGDHD